MTTETIPNKTIESALPELCEATHMLILAAIASGNIAESTIARAQYILTRFAPWVAPAAAAIYTRPTAESEPQPAAQTAPEPSAPPEPTPEPQPAALPSRVTIRSRYRDLNSRGRGTECFRLYADLSTGRCGWLADHPDAISVSRGWCPRGIRASERRCEDKVEVPTGILIIDIDKGVGPGASTSYAVGWTYAGEDGTGKIDWKGGDHGPTVTHCGTKKQGGRMCHVIEIGGKRQTFVSEA